MGDNKRRFCDVRTALLSVSVFFLAGFVGNVAAVDLFVSVNSGNDSSSGTFSAPFKTIYKAKQVVQTLPRTGPINVWIEKGTYYLDSTFVFGPADGGSVTSPITYSAYCNDTVVLSGGKKVTTAWTTSSGSIMMTNIGTGKTCDQLFLNGKRQVLARYPNYTWGTALNGNTSLSTCFARSTNWSNPTQGPGYVRGLESQGWGGEDYIITGKSSTNISWVRDHNRDSLLGNCLVENIFEELDAAGEWYYNTSTGVLYFWPPTGTNLSTATVELAYINEIIAVVGTSATSPVTNLTFNNFTLTHTHRTLFNKAYGPLLLGDWAIVRAGAVFLQNTQNINVENCFFNQVGGNGVFVNAYNSNDTIYNNKFVDPGATCVATVGLPSAVRGVLSTWIPQNMITTMSDSVTGPKTQDYPRNIVISNNQMDSLGQFEKQVTGVCISMSQYISVLHNTINGSPRSGINCNDGCWGGHNIAYNDVSHCVLETGDHGPFNSWGRDRYWTYGSFNTSGSNGTQRQPYALKDAMATNRIHNNRFQDNNGHGSYGIDLDDGSTNYRIYNNLCLSCGIKLREGFNRRSYNNIIISGQQHCHVWYAASRDTILHEIIQNSSAYDWVTNSGTMFTTSNALLDSNVFYNPGGTVSVSAATGMDVHSMSNVNPQFKNTSAGDYTVQNATVLNAGFVNFPMDSFGQMPVTAVTQCPSTGTVCPLKASSLAHPVMQCLVGRSGIAIRYWLDKEANVSISLCALNGRKLANIANSFENAGSHEIKVSRNSGTLGVLPRSCYLVVMNVEGKRNIQKIVFSN